MKKFHIFVEGDADIKFLNDYIEFLFSINLQLKKVSGKPKSDCITSTGGWTKLSGKGGETFHEQMKLNTSEDTINLIIFDADTNCSVRKKEIEEWKTEYGLNFELFLFPDNESNGELENLLEDIINSKNKPVFECWKKFEDCLPTKTTCTKNPLTIPAKKSKIYAYMEVLLGESNSEKDKAKDPNRDFKNTEHWDLKAEALKPLKAFLGILAD